MLRKMKRTRADTNEIVAKHTNRAKSFLQVVCGIPDQFSYLLVYIAHSSERYIAQKTCIFSCGPYRLRGDLEQEIIESGRFSIMIQSTLKKAALGFSLAALLSAAAAATEILNSSYDVARELFVALNKPFVAQWDKAHPNDPLTIRQSHAGSSKQALAILQGQKADVVTFNQVTDIQVLHDKGNLIPADWQARLPNRSSPWYSTMAFLVRKGNPKNIHDWADLASPDVKLVFPNPKTSGNARYTYLAAWESADKGDKAQTEEFMKKFLKNVAVFDTGGRGATTTFNDRGIGDVLISFESEINNIRNLYKDKGYEVVVPKTDILAEFPVAWVDKVVQQKGTEQVAKDYLNYLYSPQAREIVTSFYYRVNDEKTMQALADRFPATKLFTVEDKFGSWDKVMKEHFATGGEFDRLVAAGRQ